VAELALTINENALERRFDQADLIGMLAELESITELEAKKLLESRFLEKE
jgi:hypothetical protein